MSYIAHTTDRTDRPTRSEAEYDEFVAKKIKPRPDSAAMTSALYAEIYGDDMLNSNEVPF